MLIMDKPFQIFFNLYCALNNGHHHKEFQEYWFKFGRKKNVEETLTQTLT